MEKPLPCSFGSPQDLSPGSHLGAKFFQLDPKSLKDCFGVGFCCKDGSSPRTCCLCIEMMLGSFPPKKSLPRWNQWQVWNPHLRSRSCEISKKCTKQKIRKSLKIDAFWSLAVHCCWKTAIGLSSLLIVWCGRHFWSLSRRNQNLRRNIGEIKVSKPA